MLSYYASGIKTIHVQYSSAVLLDLLQSVQEQQSVHSRDTMSESMTAFTMD